MDTVQLPTSHSQRLNSGKPLSTGRCEWLWAFAPCPSEPFSRKAFGENKIRDERLVAKKRLTDSYYCLNFIIFTIDTV